VGEHRSFGGCGRVADPATGSLCRLLERVTRPPLPPYPRRRRIHHQHPPSSFCSCRGGAPSSVAARGFAVRSSSPCEPSRPASSGVGAQGEARATLPGGSLAPQQSRPLAAHAALIPFVASLPALRAHHAVGARAAAAGASSRHRSSQRHRGRKRSRHRASSAARWPPGGGAHGVEEDEC
jgi:hypothetical protein